MMIRVAVSVFAILLTFSPVHAGVSSDKPGEGGYLTLRVQGVEQPYSIVLVSRDAGGREKRSQFPFDEGASTVYVDGAQLRQLAESMKDRGTSGAICIFLGGKGGQYGWGGNPYYGWGGNPYYCIDSSDPSLSQAIGDAVSGRRGRTVVFPSPREGR